MAEYYNQLEHKIFIKIIKEWWKRAKPFYDVNRFRK